MPKSTKPSKPSKPMTEKQKEGNDVRKYLRKERSNLTPEQLKKLWIFANTKEYEGTKKRKSRKSKKSKRSKRSKRSNRKTKRR